MRETTRTLSAEMSPRSSRVQALARRVGAAVGRLETKIAEALSRPALNHRVLYRLSVLSERELLDIGLTRSDVVEAAMPENGDATHFLVQRREERLNARRGRRP